MPDRRATAARLGLLAAALVFPMGCNAGELPRPLTAEVSGTAIAQADRRISLAPMFGGRSFERPIGMYQAPGSSDWYVVEQWGRVLRLPAGPDAARPAVFLDIRGQVNDGPNEAGLLGLAFDPDYQRTRQLYLSYTRSNRGLESVISRVTTTADGAAADPSSEQILLALDQPYSNHNGGQIAFGPDGYLYAGFGDGGAGGDPDGNGQDTQTMLGAMLRLDVKKGAPYAIPPDNPFASGSGGRPEIYAWGLRNPWRWSFDRQNGALWVGDVGQNRFEEIDIVRKGGNYGWNIREGASDYDGGDRTGLIEPVAQYGRGSGCSVTGGYVYRGAAMPALRGTYIFGDYCSGRIWGLSRTGGGDAVTELIDSDLNISSFAEDHDGELYAVDHDGGIYRLVPAAR